MILDQDKLLYELDLINRELERLTEIITLQEQRITSHPYLSQVGTELYELDIEDKTLYLSRYELEELAFQMRSLGLGKSVTRPKKPFKGKRHSA